ncbi:MAG: DMT family transporter [Anaerolineales bacterium]|nr:DMT family transporter [Anaerolineales bacterium]
MKHLGILSGIAAAAIWGGMYVVSKVVLEVIPPFALLSLRLILGTLTLWIIVIYKGGIGFNRRQMLQVLGVGWVGYGISLGFQFVGTKLSTASNGSLVTSSTPAFVIIFAALILREKITRRQLLALGIATLGVLAVIDPRSAQISPNLFLGNLSLVAAAITWALYSVLIRKVTRDLDTLRVSLVAFWGGMVITLPAASLEIAQSGVGEITPGIIWGILYLGIISTALAMYLWNTAFATLEAGVASLTFFAQPVVGAGLGALLLGEKLTPLFILGGVLIGVGLWLAAGEKSTPTKTSS